MIYIAACDDLHVVCGAKFSLYRDKIVCVYVPCTTELFIMGREKCIFKNKYEMAVGDTGRKLKLPCG